MTYRTLIIDDEPDILETLSIAVEERGHAVITASSSINCLPCYNSTAQCPQQDSVCAHFLITDQNLLGLKGLDLIEQLELKGCKMPAENRAIMSGYLNNDELARADRIGCKVLHKPVTFTKLNLWLDEREALLDTSCKLAPLSNIS